jgi:hypothetical protein
LPERGFRAKNQLVSFQAGTGIGLQGVAVTAFGNDAAFAEVMEMAVSQGDIVAVLGVNGRAINIVDFDAIQLNITAVVDVDTDCRAVAKGHIGKFEVMDAIQLVQHSSTNTAG